MKHLITRLHFFFSFLLFVSLLPACQPSAEKNVFAYLLADQLGTTDLPPTSNLPGSLVGEVQVAGQPVSGVTVLVALRHGTPFVAVTSADGRYRIDNIPPGQYVPAAVGPGLEEAIAVGIFEHPWLVTIESEKVTSAPLIEMRRHHADLLPQPLATSVQLSVTALFTTATNFPPGSEADVTAYQFTYNGVTVDTLRLYLPRQLEPDTQLPLLFMIYPSPVDRWVSVSTAYAAQGYALVAISPMAARQLDVDAHAQDARVALELAATGGLGPHINADTVVALGGSFSSAIMVRLIRDTRDAAGAGQITAWVTVGGIGNAFTGTSDFYAGRIYIPPEYELLIPALGPPNLYPLSFLRYSPVYVAAEFPPTMIIHTAADTIIPIAQARELERELRAASVPVDVFYYEDVSHYLQIGDDMTDAGTEMFWRTVEFVKKVQK